MSPPDPKYPGRPTGPISPAELACASWANESMTSYVRAFDEFREGIEDCLDLTDDQHLDALLRWLNRWRARIPGAHFSEARKRLPDWYGCDQGSLPDDGVSLVEASDADLAPCADLYDDLISIMDGHAERKSLSRSARPPSRRFSSRCDHICFLLGTRPCAKRTCVAAKPTTGRERPMRGS